MANLQHVAMNIICRVVLFTCLLTLTMYAAISTGPLSIGMCLTAVGFRS